MTDRLAALIHRFRQQQQFSTSYSPLYAALFGSIAYWLADDAFDPLVKWLVAASADRSAFEVTNLLAAGLHREILNGSEEMSALAVFYPTAVGAAAAENPYDHPAKEADGVSAPYKAALRQAILTSRDVLGSFIQSHYVQTNETGRGIVWLLPLSLMGWDRVHLLDLGASAGLNLIADQRAYRFVDQRSSRKLFDLGYGRPVQFTVSTSAEILEAQAELCRIPQILSRTGCDLRPFQLRSIGDEQTLASFIWGDQVERLQRLREGITAYHEVEKSQVPVHLHTLHLPDELPVFLENQLTFSQEPLVIYNTYIKMYLPGKGLALRTHISRWAEVQQRTVLWIQWEPPKFVALDIAPEPEYGWLAWTLDCWHDDQHEQFQLGWIHPHGQQLKLLPGIQQWSAIGQHVPNPDN